MRNLLLLLCIWLPVTTLSATPERLTDSEYRVAIEKLNSACAAKSKPSFVGFCLSQKHDELSKPAITAALVAHRFALFLGRCEHSGVVQMDAVLDQAFKIEKAKAFYDEMTPQREALAAHARSGNDCKASHVNDLEIGKRLQWLANAAGKQSGAVSPEASNWFVGEFVGEMRQGTVIDHWSLKCRLGEKCALAIKQGARPDAPDTMLPMKLPVQRETEIPNNNLNGTRQAVREKPELYQDKTEGPLLEPLLKILDSQAKFEQCVDIAAEVDMSLCSLSTDPKATESSVLIFGTMKGRCGSSPFCAYYYQILRRQKGG